MTQTRPAEGSEAWILRVKCADAIGIVADVSSFLAQRRLFILESADFGDPATGLFFMRIVFRPETPGQAPPLTHERFVSEFAAIADKWRMEWELRDARVKPNVLIMVSRADHCLNDLLYRQRIGALPMNVPAIVSNHPDCAWLAERHDIPFHLVEVPAGAKEEAEARMLSMVSGLGVDLVVLARYMQVLSDTACAALAGRCINIHHSFLPGFKGAQPYRQAWERGVKLIGATAHYVTPDLDEGPIIAQAVEPADHSHTPAAMSAIGRDTEARVLAAAVKLHLEGRIFLNGGKTVILD
ncbi:MAG: formyltetrahydrofolate deformylase [Hyphomonadaceae bacterium]